ncbi:hypothetical protein [uncultured Campylobacter sp.]|jgi:hypothetical protein|nr:hypothetical protein [uncultured Campylobacter sp.]
MRKTIIAFLVALATLLTVGCSALVSVGHSNTNTINKTENKK